jgi:hypothetical protein
MHEHERWNYWMLDLGVLYLEEGGVRVGDRRERREREDVLMFVDLQLIHRTSRKFIKRGVGVPNWRPQIRMKSYLWSFPLRLVSPLLTAFSLTHTENFCSILTILYI